MRASVEDRPWILCVDDDPELLDTLELVLRRRFPECRVAVAFSGGDALREVVELHRAGDPLALILSDQLLGDTTGTELIGRVRAYFPDAARAILTGHAALESAVEGLRVGVDVYLEKPVGEEELGHALRPLLERYRLRAEQTALRRVARETSRRISALLDLGFREVERPLQDFVMGLGDDAATRHALERAREQLGVLWELSHGATPVSMDYFTAQELLEEAQTVLHRPDRDGHDLLQLVSGPAVYMWQQADQVVLFGDRDLCRRSLAQILHNAWRFSPNGSPIAVVVRAPGHPSASDPDLAGAPREAVERLRQGQALVSITNSGVLSQDDYTRIRRALDPNASAGPLPGMGLLLARELLSAMGGALLFEGAPGKEGTTFHLALPSAGRGTGLAAGRLGGRAA